ncbi:MAG TPA: hypothetical protein VMV90_01490 [Rectinemataceae bacterium]|nr:hypothetical protein [Rectinemataceae bacterium]
MKRTVIVILLLAILAAGLVADTSEYYPVRLDVVKVYAHAEGYRVVYRKGYGDFADFYVPVGWFDSTIDANGKLQPAKAELVRGDDPSYPYAVVYYKNGVFDHVILFVKRDPFDPSWGMLSPAEGAGKFKDEPLKLEF